MLMFYLGITGLFPFQSHVRERLRDDRVEGRRDLCVSAPTGSGKTLAYVLPIVERLKDRVVGRVRALVVVPTRDLIPQVEETFNRVSEAYGSEGKLKCGLDYVVTTPGKLMDMLLSGMELDALQFLVVDEADRLLDQSFQEWLPHLLNKLKDNDGLLERGEVFDGTSWGNRVQKLLFSATLTTNPAKIAPLDLNRPVYLRVGKDSGDNLHVLRTPEGLREVMVVFEGADELKPCALLEVFETVLEQPPRGILCFTGSVSSAQSLARLLSLLRPDLRVCAFHGHLSDADRSGLLSDFETGAVQVLVGSDAMARGLDLGGVVGSVINYDAPMQVGTYVHRVGRTARAGQSGLAVTLLPSSQSRQFKSLLRTLHKNPHPYLSVSELTANRVGKIELTEETLTVKWRDGLVESLGKMRETSREVRREV